MTDLWMMLVLVVALLVGNLWLLKRNSKQHLSRKKVPGNQNRTGQTNAAVQTSPVVATNQDKTNQEAPAAKSGNDTAGHSSGDSDAGAD